MPPENNPPENSDSKLKQIRTFQGDVAEALGRQKESLVSIQQTEQLKRRLEPGSSIDLEVSKSRKDFFLLFLGGFFLILLGLLGAWFGYQEYIRKATPPVVSVPEGRFISAEKSLDINIDNKTTIDQFNFIISEYDANTEPVVLDGVKYFVLRNAADATSPLITTQEFIGMIGAQAPGSLVRALDKTFMFGSLGGSRFLIFKLSSFENAFPGMLAWETTMAQDLSDIIANADKVKAAGSASVLFRDMVVRNKDVRALELPSATSTVQASPILLYSFLDNEFLIITNRLETLQNLIERLTREKLSR